VRLNRATDMQPVGTGFSRGAQMGRIKKTKTRKTKSAAAKKSRRSELSSDNKVAMLTITFIVCVLFGVLAYQGWHLHNEIITNDNEKNTLTSQISSEEARTDSINSLSDYYQSDDFIRQAAKDRLGLVEDGEIVFRNQD